MDDISQAILSVLDDVEQPLWKNRIYERLNDRVAELPRIESVSVQTVGRRVDYLLEEGYLESCIVSPDQINRDLIIAYKPSDTGRDAVATWRRQLLEDVARAYLFDHVDAPVEKPALVELLRTTFQFDAATVEALQNEYTYDELAVFLTLHHLDQWTAELSDSIGLDDTFTTQNTAEGELFADLLPQDALE